MLNSTPVFQEVLFKNLHTPLNRRPYLSFMNLEPIRFKEYSVLIVALIGVAMSMSERLSREKLLIWAAVVPLAISLVYSLFYVASYLGLSLFVFTNRSPVDQSSLLSAPLDIASLGNCGFHDYSLARLHFRVEPGQRIHPSISGNRLGGARMWFGCRGMFGCSWFC